MGGVILTPEQLRLEREASERRTRIRERGRAAEWGAAHTPYVRRRFGDLTSKKKRVPVPMHDEYLPPREWAEALR